MQQFEIDSVLSISVLSILRLKGGAQEGEEDTAEPGCEQRPGCFPEPDLDAVCVLSENRKGEVNLMQFHLNGFQPGDPEIFDPADRYPQASERSGLPAEVDVLI